MNTEMNLDALIKPNDFEATVDVGGTPEFNPSTLERIDVHMHKVNIADIDPFKYNPREIENEALMEIKDSIARSGLLSILDVCKNPASMRFELFRGGNTRLSALKLLYRETGDSKFEEINCNIHPWVDDDAEKIINHLIENEARGKLYHADKAKTLANLEVIFKQNIEQKDSAPGAESLRAENYGTTSKFIDFLQAKHYHVADQTLSTCRFTYGFLIGNLDCHLSGGLGTKKVAQIRLVYNNLKRFVKEKDIADFKVDDFGELFKKSLKKYNNSSSRSKQSYDFYNLVNVVALELLAEYPFNELFGSDKEALTKIMLRKKPKAVKEKEQDGQRKVEPDADNIDNSEVDISVDESQDNNHTDIVNEADDEYEDDIKIIPEAKSSVNDSSAADAFLADNGFDGKGELVGASADDEPLEPLEAITNIKELRKQIYLLANSITHSLGFDVEIKQIKNGVGFVLETIPMSDNVNCWCWFYILLDNSTASDPLTLIKNKSAIIDLDSGIGKNNNLIELYMAKDIEQWEDAMYKLLDVSGVATPFPSLIGSFKRGVSKNIWQRISQLEFLTYQVVNGVKSKGVGLWD